jgi:hypothetical protein
MKVFSLHCKFFKFHYEHGVQDAKSLLLHIIFQSISDR